MAGAPIGNQNGAKGKEWSAALRRAMAHRGEGDYRKTLQAIAARVVKEACESTDHAVWTAAWREIAEREDGKATQSMEVDAAGNLLSVLAGLGRASAGSSDDPPLA